MAGLDGVEKPTRCQLRTMPLDRLTTTCLIGREEDQARLESIPTSLEEALEALQEDHDYLLAGGVFNQELIDSWIEEKMKEVVAVRNRPHPFEMNLYYSL